MNSLKNTLLLILLLALWLGIEAPSAAAQDGSEDGRDMEFEAEILERLSRFSKRPPGILTQ